MDLNYIRRGQTPAVKLEHVKKHSRFGQFLTGTELVE
jgi:hypothetical protein